jgi:peroxiredoxin-like protein
MSTEHYYEVDLQWKDSRKGILSSPVLSSNIEVATPPEFPKGIPDIWSPEHLFVAAVNSCLMTTFLAIAENSKLEFESFNSNAKGKLEMVEGKYMITEVLLSPFLTVQTEADIARAQRVLEKSETACLISNSIKSKVFFKPVVKLAVHSL